MNKKMLYRVWMKLRRIKVWWFLLAALLSLLVSVYALRANNLEMVRLKQAVYEADKNGGDVQGALTELQRYVTTHMNTDLSGGANAVYPPIQLKYTYERLLAANKQQQASNEQIYSDAQAHCERLHPTGFSGGVRVPCIQEYVRTHGAGTTMIPDSLYKFDFMSPLWSPDLAGFSVLATLLFIGLAILLGLMKRWLKKRI